MNDTHAFLQALFPQLPEGARLLIWGLPDKRSLWCASVEEAVAAAESIRPKNNVYFGIGLTGKEFGATQRGLAKDRIAIPALWGDFDLAHAGAHKKQNLPPNRGAILEVIAEAGLPPTIAVNSGHGLQCFWAFHELWEFSSDEDRERAEEVVRRWNYTLRDLFRKRGWDMDSTFDLARVLRVPGTLNRKVELNPVPVEIVHLDGPRYTLNEILPRLIEEDPRETRSRGKQVDGIQVADDLTIDPSAVADVEMLEALKAVDSKFASSWEKKRKDLPDQSPSSYDMSLATLTANAGWEDQQIVNMMIHWRRKHKEEPKLRLDYYRMTLRKAKAELQKKQAVESLNEMLHASDESFDDGEYYVPDGDDETVVGTPEPRRLTNEQEAKRQAILKHVSDLLGFQVLNLIKYVSSEPTYRLETENGGIMLGSVVGLIKQEALRNQVAALTGYYIQKFKPNIWDTIAQSLLHAVEEQSAGEEATDEGSIRAWLRIYLLDNPPSRAGISQEVASMCSPFIDPENGFTYVFGIGLQDWLKKKFGENLGPKKLGSLLRIHGASPEVVPCIIHGKKTTRSVWRLPFEREEGEF